MAEERQWVERNAIAFSLGELGDDDETRFRELAGEEFEDLLTPDLSSVGHVPAALIARWGSAGRALSETERSLVEQHLRWCPSCQQELQLVGFELPGRESGQIVGRGWFPWFGGAVIGAAAVFAFVMLSPRPSPVIQGQHLEVVSPRALRGADTPVYVLGSDATAFLLAVALPGDLGSGSTLILTDPDGSVVLERAVDPAPSAQVLVLADPVFITGEYRVQVRMAGEDGVRDLGRFEIQRPE